ncbi:MAG: MFS transporter, partial [Xanthomonadales bacterium]|nr:MFS transporter [Gammaproteobacteria bacterium]NNK04209.1 MFS transporter [Xanthomonadales bacterium]
MRSFQKNRTNTFFSLLSLPSTAMGFALSIQISALSWILTTQYKLDIHDVGLVWAAGPLAGIIGQVIIGVISDKVWFWNGRRRPFILIGGVLAALMLLALPNLDVISAGLGVGGILGVAIAVALTLDLSINVSFNPTRSLIADVTRSGDERTKGYTWMQSISGTFGVLAYAIGALFNNYVLIYGGAVIVLLFSVVPTLFITEPRELEADDDDAAYADAKHQGSESSMLNMLIAIRPLWGFLVYDVYAMGRR